VYQSLGAMKGPAPKPRQTVTDIAGYRSGTCVTAGNGTDAQVKPLLNQNGHAIIENSFCYQACYERECYVPQTIPLKWTLHYADLDRQRVPAELQHRAP
jgi:hypothetical protein